MFRKEKINFRKFSSGICSLQILNKDDKMTLKELLENCKEPTLVIS